MEKQCPINVYVFCLKGKTLSYSGH